MGSKAGSSRVRRVRAQPRSTCCAFIREMRPLARVSEFSPQHAADFVRYLRNKRMAPNGHDRARKRLLRDAGMKFILETCGALFN